MVESQRCGSIGHSSSIFIGSAHAITTLVQRQLWLDGGLGWGWGEGRIQIRNLGPGYQRTSVRHWFKDPSIAETKQEVYFEQLLAW